MTNTARPPGPDLHSLDGSPVRTLADLARLAGVSAGTVSRALTNNSLVNADTRARIQALARRHGFHPNQMASRLRRQTTGAIGVAIPLGREPAQHMADGFIMTLLGLLTDALADRGYDLMLRRIDANRDPNWIDRFVSSRMIDGLIVIGQSDQFARIEEAARSHQPLVVWGNHRDGQHHCTVGTDNRLGGHLAAERLIAIGARKVAFLGDTGSNEFAARFAGAAAMCRQHGIPIRAFPAPLTADARAAAIAAHLDAITVQGYDGIFAACDTIAVGCLHELGRRHALSPLAIRLVGFDDLPIAAQTIPALTTVRQDLGAGARGLVDLLLRRLAGEVTDSLILPPELIIRETA